MPVRLFARCLLVASSLWVGATNLPALPKPNESIDPTKRSSISTAGAIRPAASTAKGDGVVGGRVIRMAKLPAGRSTVKTDRAAIDVRETREKANVRKPGARSITARKFDVRRASDRPAVIPAIDRARFAHMIREYEEGRVPAAEMVSGDIRRGDKQVSLADINRFAGPRAALESQGIPVTPAGSGETDAPAATPVPVSQGKNAGAEK